MYSVHRKCKPNPLVAIIATQRAQSIQYRVTEMRTNLGTIKVSLQRKKHAMLLPMSGGLTANKSRPTRAAECGHAHHCT